MSGKKKKKAHKKVPDTTWTKAQKNKPLVDHVEKEDGLRPERENVCVSVGTLSCDMINNR